MAKMQKQILTSENGFTVWDDDGNVMSFDLDEASSLIRYLFVKYLPEDVLVEMMATFEEASRE